MMPDDQNIKAEIEDISRRIDRIIRAVNRAMPEKAVSEHLETAGGGIYERTELSTQTVE